ncbi:TetR/AcrR family transcriptional regulator [Frondihabitans sucicola]|uniref:TetR/AcrR family transcriptional regulator n=1 Tax=Frondihabitans sucicola TaxID=1268041 RepID=UPI002572B08E|nr:TetR/AcrR family transcriptional regulator [Frondihabitans sucicola]
MEDASDRVALIRSADHLFTIGHIRSTTIDAIDAHAHRTRAAFDAVFRDKDDLIVAVLDYRHAAWNRHLADAMAPSADPRDKILSIFSYLETWFAEPTFHGCAFVNVYAELGPEIPWAADYAAKHKNVFIDLVTRLALEAGLPESAGTSIALLAEGAQVTAALTRTIAPAREARSAAAMLIALYQEESGPGGFDL